MPDWEDEFYCAEADVMYEPLDMNSSNPSQVWMDVLVALFFWGHKEGTRRNGRSSFEGVFFSNKARHFGGL